MKDMRAMSERDQLQQARLARLRREIDLGIEQIERGEFSTYTVDLAFCP